MPPKSYLHWTPDTLMMEMDQGHLTERILDLTLEIIYLLTGEKYAAVKITCIESLVQGMYPAMSERWGGSQNSIALPPPHSPILERNNMQKIQEITNKIIDLLTGELHHLEDPTPLFLHHRTV
ncbi:oocyte zinc finger protein XlCOF29-like isoform X2 [Rana temporaria]|uniref:oocyte zinc finger protein XlCOF29-like isoform X2 n=1 Tax=Rana temporaria TaxID=8407 RepID=UPI001AADD971|nr:oocyte zinc finger protein XlCOF29-like isoform X2 [Rana temporaria]XP_040177098.1 oocyte zinc finger protein XlCOF29-like isoform X2 [Rana temporaria]XP_040177100.1 oocyte zinc finger protein XlCOF29-like isoform X2 [Rana temporaria]